MNPNFSLPNNSSLSPGRGQPPPYSQPHRNSLGSTGMSSASLSSSKPVTEVKLFNNNKEREMFDNMADLFSIIKTTEALEKAYVRDAINAEEYKKQCGKLIMQFKAAQTLTKDYVPDIRKFMADYRLDCKAAVKRLIEEGIPLSGATIDDSARTVAETVQFFITAMDLLKLNQAAVDQIQPYLTELLESLSKVSHLPQDWEGKTKIRNWLVLLHKMRASEELDAEQVRQLSFDLDSAYNAFHKSLPKRNS